MTRPNILLIAIDTLRADHLGCYGYDQPTSPFLDEWAKKAVLYETCISHAPWTIPSFTSLMSGLDPIRSRVVGSPWNVPNYAPIKFDDTKPMLAELLRDAGYATFAVDNLVEMASHPAWFVRGFQTSRNLTDRMALRHHHVLAEQVTDAMLEWEPKAGAPWFAFLHYWDPHLPYNYPRSYDARLAPWRPKPVATPSGRPYLPRRGYADEVSDAYLELIAQYDRSILYMDDEIRRLFAGLEQRGQLDDAIVVVCGDHGEAMVEHGVLFEHALVYDPTIHVPLIIKDPRSGASGRRSELTQHHDVMPTLLALADIHGDWSFTGKVLTPFAPAPVRAFTVTIQDGGAAIRALRTRDWKLICHYALDQPSTATSPAVERVELYSLKEDPFELNDLSSTAPDVRDGLMAKLNTWRRESLDGTSGSDPLLEPEMRIDFRDYPGDPELVEFYRALPSMAAKR